MKTFITFLLLTLIVSSYAEQNEQTTQDKKCPEAKNDNLLFFMFIFGTVYLLRHTTDYEIENPYYETSGSDEENDEDEEYDTEGEEEDDEDEEDQTEGEDAEEEEISDHETEEKNTKSKKKPTLKRRSARIGKTPDGAAY